MEAVWIADRSLVRHLRQQQPQWTNQQLADVTGRSVAWVKKWKKRLAETPANDDRSLYSRSRARQHPPAKISQPRPATTRTPLYAAGAAIW